MDRILKFLNCYGIDAIEDFERWSRGVKIGFVVNPIAGMGGRVGLKGTDGKYDLALKLGAKPVSNERAFEFLRNLRLNVEIYTCSGEMGERVARMAGYDPNVIYKTNDMTTSEDTKLAVERMRNLDLIVFVGGDGTARDVCEVVGDETPVIGVPSGVKMYSGVFGLNPRACAEVVRFFVRGLTHLELREVVDVDESSLSDDRIVLKIFGYLNVPVVSNFVQGVKRRYGGNLENLMRNFLNIFDRDGVYIFGPGGTVSHIVRSLGFEKTVTGVDVYVKGEFVKDVSERELLSIVDRYDAWIVITPIGGQGFIFGRGNLQISPDVLRRVERSRIIVVSTVDKLRDIDFLRVDTGDEELDRDLEGEIEVLTDVGLLRFFVKA
ncbi:MAG: ATP-NAD kinase [Archaeoglobales archaeon]|nr:MAG: ATP-NAD kinase [Archaeoglobales archaeon]